MGIKIRQGGQWIEVASGSSSTGGSSDPVGTIVAWAGSVSTIPSEYQLCDGSAAQTTELVAITGANVPDLRDRFIVGASDISGTGTYPGIGVGSTGGSANAVLIAHNHSVTTNRQGTTASGGGDTGGADKQETTGIKGIDAAGNSSNSQTGTNANLPPYYALCYIIKHTATSGSGGGGGSGSGGSGGEFVLLSEQSATGSTSVEFTGIPSDALEITLMFNGVSANGGDDYLVQLGTSSGYITSGYVATSQNEKGSSQTDSSQGFIVLSDNNNNTHHGKFDINKFSNTAYTFEGQTGRSTVAGTQSYGSLNSVSGTIDRLKIILTGGNNFDAGSFSLSYKTSGSGGGSGGADAWGSINGTNGNIINSFNATSSRTSTGQYTVTFNNAMPNNTYAPIITTEQGLIGGIVQSSITTTGFQVKTFNASTNALQDSFVSFAVHATSGGSGSGGGSSLVKLGTVATTSGTEAAFTNIPSTAKKIIVSMYRFSFTGTTDDFIMEVGDSTGYVQSGYQSSYDNRDSSPDAKYRTNAYGIADDTSYAWEYNINIELVNVSGNSWIITHMGGNNDNDSTPGAILYGGGSITLSNALDKLRIKTVNGRTLDNGEVTVYYETASDPSSGDVTSTWTLGENSSIHWTFTGPGGLSNTDDPKIYLARGQTYEFVNNSGGSHPFQIQQSNGSAYSTGVTYPGGGSSASSGTIRFEVPFDAPNTLQYKCTSHSDMGNTIIVYPDLSP